MTRPLVLITGGSGYFGSLLLRKLLERGARCRVFDLNDADDRPPEVEFIQGDICAYDTLLAPHSSHRCTGVSGSQCGILQRGAGTAGEGPSPV